MYAIDEENKLFGKNAQNLFKNKKTVHSSFTLNLVGALAAVSAVLLITGVIALSLTTYNPYIITSVLGTTISAAKTIGFTSIGLSIASCAGALFFKAKTTRYTSTMHYAKGTSGFKIVWQQATKRLKI